MSEKEPSAEKKTPADESDTALLLQMLDSIQDTDQKDAIGLLMRWLLDAISAKQITTSDIRQIARRIDMGVSGLCDFLDLFDPKTWPELTHIVQDTKAREAKPQKAVNLPPSIFSTFTLPDILNMRNNET